MDAKLGATLRATKCSAETYKKAIAHKKGRSYHEAIALILKNRTLHGEDCGPLLEQCFSKLSDHYAALCCAPTSSAGPEKELQTVVSTLPPRQVERHDDDALPGFGQGLGGAVRRREAAEI